MNRRWRLGVGAAVLAAVGLPGLAAAAPFTSETIYEPISFMRFCADSQAMIANIDEAELDAQGITLGGQYYSDMASFVTSKSSVVTSPPAIMTTQYVSYRDPERSQPDQIRCKYRSGESLDEGAWPEGQSNQPPPFTVEPVFGFGPEVGGALSTDQLNDKNCSDINQRTIDTVWETLSPADQAASPYQPEVAGGSTLVTEPDTSVGTGAEWTQPFPTLKLQGGTLVVPSKTLYAPTTAVAPNTGLPSVFGGAHYCTLVAPEYLRDVLLGDATVS